MPSSNSFPPPIPLDKAIKEAAYWRNYCKKLLKDKKGSHGEQLPTIKAFFIPIGDLQAVLDLARNDSGMSVAGMRIYFRLKSEEDDLSQLEAMIVPVVLQPDPMYLRDWVQLKHPMADQDESLVFDFTKPCPTECDPESPLSHP